MPKSYGELHNIFTQIITKELSYSILDELTEQDLELMFKIVSQHLETLEDRQKQTRNLIPKDKRSELLNKGKNVIAFHFEPYRPSDDWKIISDIWVEVSLRIDGPTWTERVIRKVLNDNEIALYYRYLVLTGYIQPNPTQNAWLEGIARKMNIKPGSLRSTFMMYGKSNNRAANGKPALRTSLRKVALYMGSKYPDAVREIKADLKR